MNRIHAYRKNGMVGFTLVEMIVVLVMLSILAAIAVPSYLGYVDNNKERQCEIHRKALASRLEEMSVLGGELTDVDMNSEENGCPAGGTYTFAENTITCDKHGSTTVILKSNSSVKADVNNVQTEAPKATPAPPPPANNGVWTPKPEEDFTISVTSQYPSMCIDAHQMISAQIIEEKGCIKPYGFVWSCDPDIVEIVGSGTGQSIEIRAKNVGTCKISCTATATTESGQISSSADVTVNIETIVPHLEFTISPNPLGIEVGKSGKLEVNWRNDYYCTVDRFLWSAEPADNVSLSINEDGTEATVTALKATSAGIPCIIYCKAEATAKIEAGGQKLDPVIVDVPVTVKSESKNQKLLKNVPKPLLIDGNITGIDMAQYVEAEGGVWETSSSNITCSGQAYNNWIAANGAGECELTYTLKGDSESVKAKVVYPIREFHSTTDTKDVLTMKIGDSGWDFPVTADPANTTDISANWVWRCIGEDGIISYSLNPEKTEATVTALSEGYVELEVAARSEYESWQSGSDVWKTLKWKINVIDPNKLTGISVNNIGMKANDVRQIQVNCNPPGINREGISFGYLGYGDCISIDANGNIKAVKKGSTMVTVQARENGKDLEGISCTFNVAVTDLQSIEVEPQSVNVKSGETTTAKIVYKPEGADISQVNFELGWYDSNKFNITKKQDGILEITGSQACSDQWTEVKAYFSGEQVANCNFKVSVTPTNSGGTSELQGIEVVQKIDTLIVDQQATVTMYPDESGDIVVKPVPLSEAALNSAHFDNYVTSNCINPVTNNGKTSSLMATSAGKVTVYIRIYLSGSGTPFEQTIMINVIEDSNGPIKYKVNGSEVSSTPWSVLKDYIKRKTGDPNAQPSSALGIFAVSNSELYVLKENQQLMWKESYDDVTFGEYLKLDNNIDQFVKVDTSQIIWAGNPFSGGIGSILGRNDVYYVCVRTVPDNERSNTNNDEFINKYFVRLS